MNVLLRRRADGVGDWLFLLACIKHYNQQQPWMRFYVDFELAAREGVERTLPPIIKQAYEASDVTWYEPLAGIVYDVTIPHVVYKFREPVPYVESMLAQLVTATGRDARYDPACVPRFVYSELDSRPRRPYMVTVSKGKDATAHKDWPRRKFDELAAEIHGRGVDVVQAGATNDTRLASASLRFLGYSLEAVAGLLAGARLFVGLENGLAVLASWLGCPTVVIYQGGDDNSAGLRVKRWSGPAIARMVRPGVADVVAVARKELKC